MRELARQFHGGRVLKAAAHEPRGEISFDRKRLADPQRAGLLGQSRPAGDRLQEGRNAGDQHLGRLSGPSSDLEHADAIADGLVLDHPLGRERFVDGKPQRLQRRKEAQVADQSLDFIQSRTDDHEHGRRCSGQRGGDQRAG